MSSETNQRTDYIAQFKNSKFPDWIFRSGSGRPTPEEVRKIICRERYLFGPDVQWRIVRRVVTDTVIEEIAGR